MAALHADAEALLAPCCTEVVRRSPEPFIQAIYDLASPRLVFGRVILIGDAAFVARPHAGMGVTKAALDAQTLARAFAAPDRAAALADWQATRGCATGRRWSSARAGSAPTSATRRARPPTRRR